jgi:hypothetical protein
MCRIDARIENGDGETIPIVSLLMRKVGSNDRDRFSEAGPVDHVEFDLSGSGILDEMKQRLGADHGCASIEQRKEAQGIELGASGASAEKRDGGVLGQPGIGFEYHPYTLLVGDRFHDSGRHEKRSSSLLVLDRFFERLPDFSAGSLVQIPFLQSGGPVGISWILLPDGRNAL